MSRMDEIRARLAEDMPEAITRQYVAQIRAGAKWLLKEYDRLNVFENTQAAKLLKRADAIAMELLQKTQELDHYKQAEREGRLVVLPDCAKCNLNGYAECSLFNCVGKISWPEDERQTDLDNYFEEAEAALQKEAEDTQNG